MSLHSTGFKAAMVKPLPDALACVGLDALASNLASADAALVEVVTLLAELNGGESHPYGYELGKALEARSYIATAADSVTTSPVAVNDIRFMTGGFESKKKGLFGKPVVQI